MRARAVLCVVIAVAAVVAPAVSGVALGQPPAGANQAGQTATATATNTTIAIHLRPNGDARFLVSMGLTLHDANESAAFRALSREFEDGTGDSVAVFRRAANQSSIVTGRGMNVTNVTRNATITGENTSRTDTGRLVLGFTWTNFARTNRNRVVVGDAFNATRGTWLPGLTPNQTLRIESPPGYTVTRSPVGFTNGTLEWEGPATFEPGTPVVWFERSGGSHTTQPANHGGSGLFGSMSPSVLGGGLIVGVGIVVLGVYALARREGDDEHTSVGDASTPKETTEDTPQTEEPADDELLSDEERVERLLARNDGRMKQATIVSETGWSNAKVSQLLSAMDEDGRINKLRIGRENLISLPDE